MRIDTAARTLLFHTCQSVLVKCDRMDESLPGAAPFEVKGAVFDFDSRLPGWSCGVTILTKYLLTS